MQLTNTRSSYAATLAQIRDDRFAGLDGAHKDPFRFKVVMRAEMGMGRGTGGRSPGFIEIVLGMVEKFYGGVVQQITPWQPSAPKLIQSKPPAEPEADAPAVEYDPFWRTQQRPETEEGSDFF
ncbi:MAG TPA: hypothetical protein VIW94_10730 [Acidimicrobiia bacterium]